MARECMWDRDEGGTVPLGTPHNHHAKESEHNVVLVEGTDDDDEGVNLPSPNITQEPEHVATPAGHTHMS